MRTSTPVIDLVDAVFYLRIKLGKLRAWDDFLGDNRRGRQSINGLTLEPICRKKGRFGKTPMYAVRDVQQFVADVLASNPGIKPEPIKISNLDAENLAGWRSPLNLFDEKDGLTYLPKARPVAALPPGFSSFHGYAGTLH